MSPSISPCLDVLSIEFVIKLVNGANARERASIINAVFERKPMGFLDAIVLGVISPITSTSNVITSVDTADPAVSSPFNKRTNSIVEREAIKIFTKLLATSIPPIVFSKSSFAFFILLFLFESLS